MTSNIFLKQFTIKFEEILKGNLVCLLLIGSVKNQAETPFSDIDLVAIVKDIDFKQMRQVRKLIRQTSQLLDLSFLCLEEIPSDSNRFRLGSHGCYHLELILKKAKVLSGNNIFTKIKSPSKKALRLSVFEKIIEYTWWARRMFVESNRELLIENNYKINTRLIKMLRDLMFLSGLSNVSGTPKEIVDSFMEMYPSLLLPQENKILVSLADLDLAKENAYNTSDKYLEIRLVIVNKIHKCANKILKYEYMQR
mgnify:CR=1 FL=1